MSDWQKNLAPFLNDLENQFDDMKYRLHNYLGGPGPIKIIPYRGYGRPNKLYLKGRVLEDKGVTLATPDDSLWDNLLNMYQRMESDEIPHARLRARFGDLVQEIEADEEGYFEVWFEPKQPMTSSSPWQMIQLELTAPHPKKQVEPVLAEGQVFIPSAKAQYTVISDIDDTVVHTDATHLLNMARNVFMSNARTRLPFPGVAAFYRALYGGPDGQSGNPLFYVSSSPWNLYDLLAEFFSLQGIPDAVLFLRDWGLTHNEILPTDNREHKLNLIHQMLDFYPQMPFILIGDSGQQDPEIYTEIAEQYPQRIQAVYIRNVSRGLQRPAAMRALADKVVQAHSSMVIADDTLTLAQHAFQQGWISADSFPDIHQEKSKDEQPPTPLEAILGEPKPGQGPTVVVEKKDEQETGPK
jgi:phosphatidate phosphatase APP1